MTRSLALDSSFPTITPHDLRHTAASLAISAGANPKAVQRMLGHASAAMTLDTYADLFEDDLNNVSEHLAAARSQTVVGFSRVWASKKPRNHWDFGAFAARNRWDLNPIHSAEIVQNWFNITGNSAFFVECNHARSGLLHG